MINVIQPTKREDDPRISSIENAATRGTSNDAPASSREVTDPCIEISGLNHELHNPRSGETYEVVANKLTVPRGCFMSILGPSGSGKSTLMSILALARRPARANSTLLARSTSHLPVDHFVLYDSAEDSKPLNIAEAWRTRRGRKQIDRLRQQHFGFCLQHGKLLENLTVYENVELPLRVNRVRNCASRIRNVLDMLSDDGARNLWDRRSALPSTLSGGEYQRVALATAIAHEPQVLFVDEPTGSLDADTARRSLDALNHIKASSHTTVVMITHDETLARSYSDHLVHMRTVSDGSNINRGIGHIDALECRVCDKWVNTDANWRDTA